MDRLEGAAMLLRRGSVLVVSSFSTLSRPLSPPHDIQPAVIMTMMMIVMMMITMIMIMIMIMMAIPLLGMLILILSSGIE